MCCVYNQHSAVINVRRLGRDWGVGSPSTCSEGRVGGRVEGGGGYRGWRIPGYPPWVEEDRRRVTTAYTARAKVDSLWLCSTLIQPLNDLLPTPPLFSLGWGRVVDEDQLKNGLHGLRWILCGQYFSCWGCTLYVQPNTSLLSAVLHSINHLTCTQQMWFRSRIGVDHRTNNIICNGNLCNCIIV